MSAAQTEKQDGTLPTMIREYQVESLIGCGRTGKVYKAKDPRSGRAVAIRCFNSECARKDDSAYKLDHPNLVRCYSFDTDAAGHAFLVMEYMDGGTVSDAFQKTGMLDPQKVAEIGIACCNALKAIGEGKLFYYDVTPDRIMVSADGKYKLSPSGFYPCSDLTEYMAPEQFTAMENSDFRSTVYSLGVTMYQLLSGKLPFESPDRETLKKMHESAEPRVPGFFRSDVPADLEYIIMRCIQKDGKDRYQQWDELRADLQTFSGGGNALPSIKDNSAPDAGKRRSVLIVSSEKKKKILINGIAGGICVVLAGLILTVFALLNQPEKDILYTEDGEYVPVNTVTTAPVPLLTDQETEAKQRKIWEKVRLDARESLATGRNCSFAAANLQMYADSPDNAVREEALSLLNEIDLQTGIRDYLCSSIFPLLENGKYKEAYSEYKSKENVYRERALEQMLSEISHAPELFAEMSGKPDLSGLPVMKQYEELQKIPELSSNSIAWWCVNAALQNSDEKSYQDFRKKLPVRLGAAYDQYVQQRSKK